MEYDTQTSSVDKVTALHNSFDAIVSDVTQGAREFCLDNEGMTRDELIGQILMDFINDDGFTGDDPQSAFDGKFNVKQKQNMIAVASHLGPDWAQALYHAAVFITKVA